MKINVKLTSDIGDSEAAIKENIQKLRDIFGEENLTRGHGPNMRSRAIIYEGDFFDFYKKLRKHIAKQFQTL